MNKNMEINNIILQIEELKNNQDFESAKKLTEKNISKYSDDYRLYEELADIYIFMGNIKSAMQAIDFALELNPSSATGNYLKGFMLLSKNKFSEALDFLKTSNFLNGNNSEVLRNIGWAYFMLGESEKGILILKRALNLSPNDQLIMEDLAMALIGIGEISQGNNILTKIGKTNNLLGE